MTTFAWHWIVCVCSRRGRSWRTSTSLPACAEASRVRKDGGRNWQPLSPIRSASSIERRTRRDREDLGRVSLRRTFFPMHPVTKCPEVFLAPLPAPFHGRFEIVVSPLFKQRHRLYCLRLAF